MLRRVLMFVLAAALVALAIALAHHGWRAYAAYREDFPWDGLVDWGGARMLLAGVDPYGAEAARLLNLEADHGLAHPPTAFVWFLPVADIEIRAMKAVWTGLTMTLVLLYTMLLAQVQRWRWQVLGVAVVSSALLASSFMLQHLLVVSLSTLIAFLCFWSYYHLERGEDWIAGLLLGLALTLKFYPAVIIVGLMLLGRVKVAFGAALGWLLVAVPVTARVGLHGWLDFFAQQQPYVRRWAWHIRNASIYGVVQRWAYPVCDNVPNNPAHDAPWRVGGWIASGLALAVVALSLYVARRSLKIARRWDVIVALLTTVSLITGPYTWEHYRITLVFPLAVIVREGVLARGRGRVVLLAVALAAAVLLGLDVFHKETLWTEWRLGHTPALHFWLHAEEVANWLPYWLIGGALVALLLRPRAHGVGDDGLQAVAR